MILMSRKELGLSVFGNAFEMRSLVKNRKTLRCYVAPIQFAVFWISNLSINSILKVKKFQLTREQDSASRNFEFCRPKLPKL